MIGGSEDGKGTGMKTPDYVLDTPAEACVECGHLHYFPVFKGYGVCPVCDCTGQEDAPYLAEHTQGRPTHEHRMVAGSDRCPTCGERW